MKKLLIFGLGLLVLLFIGRQVLVPKIAERGFERLISERLGTDPTTMWS